MIRTLLVVVGVAIPLVADAGGVPLLDSTGGSHGAVVAALTKGSVRMKIIGLPPLPAQPPGASFTATVYKAYLTSTADPAVEIFLADVYPNAKSTAVSKVALKGDISRLGLNRVVVAAYSKDARDEFDVLTAAIAP
jgi:hypothetical protein